MSIFKSKEPKKKRISSINISIHGYDEDERSISISDYSLKTLKDAWLFIRAVALRWEVPFNQSYDGEQTNNDGGDTSSTSE